MLFLRQQRLASLGLLFAGLALLLPFIWPRHVYPMLTFHAEWTAFLLGMIVAALVLGRREAPPPLPWLSLALIGFCGLLYLQMLLGQVAYPERSVIGMFYVLWAALLVWAGAGLRARFGIEKVCLVLQGFLAAGGLLMAATGFMQYFQVRTVIGELSEPELLQGMHGVIAQRNLFANYVACGLISSIFLHVQRRIGPATAALLVVPMAVALGYSESRSAWVYIVILCAAVLWLSFAARKAVGWRTWALCALAVAAFTVARLVLAADIPRYAGTAGLLWFVGIEHGDEPLAPRTLLAWHAWNIFKAHPLFGVGFGEFAWNVFQNSTHLGGNASPGLDRNAHNIVLHLLAETGLAGLALIGSGVAAWIWEILRVRITAERLWIVAVLAVQAAHSMVEFPLWFAQFLGMASLLCGVATERGVVFGVSRLGRYVTIAILVLGFGGLALVLRDYRDFKAWFDQAAQEQNAGDLRHREELQELLRLHESSMFSPFFELMIAEVMTLDSNSLEAKLALNTQVMHVVPLPTAACRQAVLLALAGRQSEAWEYWQRLHIVYPQYEHLFRAGLERFAAADSRGIGKLADRARAEYSTKDASKNRTNDELSGNDFCSVPLARR